MIKRLHAWQDRLQEPWRMIFTLGMILVLVIIPIATESVAGVLIGVGMSGLLIASRKAYLDRGPRA